MSYRIATLTLILLATPALAAKPVSCLDPSQIVSKTIDGGALIVQSLGGQYYRNRPTGNCRAADRWMPGEQLIFIQQGSRLCRGDRLRIADTGVPGAACILGRFEPIVTPDRR